MYQFGGERNTHVTGKAHIKNAEELEEALEQLLVEERPLPTLINFHGRSFKVSEGYHCGFCFAEHEREPEPEEMYFECGRCFSIGVARKLSVKEEEA